MKAYLSDNGEEIDVNFITFCTDYNKTTNLRKSLNDDITCLIGAKPFTHDFKPKSVAVLNHLRNGNYDDNSLWFVLDAYDVVVLSNNMTFTPPLDGKVLFNAESNCYPDASLATKYPNKETSRYKYLNAGAYVGRKKDIVALLEECIPHMGNGSIDQLVFSRKYVEEMGSGTIQLDSNCDIFQTLYQIPQDECLTYSNIAGEARYLHNKETDTFPFIIHGNGCSDMSQFLAEPKKRYNDDVLGKGKVNVVVYTPCSRPNNLEAMHKSIVKSCGDKFEWIVCFDSSDVPHDKVTGNTIYLNVKNAASRSGNAQRNACIEHAIANCDTSSWMYCLDDDNIMHENLYAELMAQPDDVDMVVFQQLHHNGKKRIGASEVIGVGQNDTANFAVRLRTIGDVRWVLDKYEADGMFAFDVSQNAKNIVRIHKPLCYYNYLRPTKK